MKKLILILSAITLLSCSEYNEQRECYSGTLVVLKKETQSGVRGVGYWYFLYIFDGKEAKYYQTSEKDYNKYNVNDTLPTLVLKTTLTKNK
jgi:hypothetical protein